MKRWITRILYHAQQGVMARKINLTLFCLVEALENKYYSVLVIYPTKKWELIDVPQNYNF